MAVLLLTACVLHVRLKRVEGVSREREARLRLLLAQVRAVVWTVDHEMRVTTLSGEGLTERELREVPSLNEALHRAFAGESVRCEVQRAGRWLQGDVEPLRDAIGEIVGAIGVMVDVTESRANTERFARLARHDSLTDLPNRLALGEQLPPIIDRALAAEESVAVLFVDLDRFKTINDTLGHQTGDELLKAVGQRLREHMDSKVAIFRPGGDEFVIVIDGIRHKRTIASVAMDVLSAFRYPFTVKGRELYVTASVGTSVFPQNAQTAEQLLAFADSAMYRAKEAGRNNAKFYDGTMHAHVLERMGLEQDLRHAVAREELKLVYQPIVDVATRRIALAEALVRWHHPLLGDLAPAVFIPIAEESGIIVEISRWVLREACARAAQIRRSGAPDFRIAVNLSPRDFFEPDFPAELAAILDYTGLPANALDAEVTEGVMLSDMAVGTIMRLHAMGVNIVVDDFGTGYSSLAYLKRLPVSAIKVDKSFMTEITTNAYDQGIVKAIAALAQTLGVRVITEGIESQAQWDFVRSLRCDQAQGYYFHRPSSWEAVVELAAAAAKTAAAQSAARVIPLYGQK
jgi:diguanylate cyclase (GGDEF)-like protein